MKTYIYVIATAVSLFATSMTGAQEIEKPCISIGGQAMGQFYNENGDVLAPMFGTFAATRATVKSQKKTLTGVLLEMEHVFTTSDGGGVRTRDIAELTDIPGKKDSHLLEVTYTIVESFGRLKGYRGTFNSYGAIKLGMGEGLLRYSGQICQSQG